MHFLLIALLLCAGMVPALGKNSFDHCFTSDQFDGWRAAGKKQIYVRTVQNRYYRIDLSRDCSTLARPYAQLILAATQGSRICSVVDLTVKASGPNDVIEPCFVRTMSELFADQIRNLSSKAKP